MPTATETRANFKQALNQSEQGISVPVQRGSNLSALVDARRLRNTLALLINPDVRIVNEGEWVAIIGSVPSIIATGNTLDAMFEDLVSAAREYAFDWNDHLRHAPNHAENWGFVQVVMLSTDPELREWFTE